MKRVIGWMWLALVLGGCGGSDGVVNPTTGSSQPGVSRVSFGAEGGSLRNGDLLVEFASNAVSAPVTVSDRVVTLTTIPSYVKPLSSVHKVDISSPPAYQRRTARLTFTVAEPHAGASVYHSDDGVNWLALGGDTQDGNVSAKTHKFSYFFAGVADPSASPTYVQIENNSESYGSFFIFRTNPNQGSSTSLAMMSTQLAPRERGTLGWSENYGFFWDNLGELVPGVVVNAAQIVAADLTTANQIVFFGNDFGTPQPGPATDTLYIFNQEQVPFDQIVEGMTVSGYPAYATQAFPNFTVEMQPGQDTTYLAFSNFIESGSAIDVNQVMPFAVKIPPGSSNFTAIYTLDGTWQVTPNP